MASKHIPIDTWLEALGMKEYQEVFRDFHGVEVGLQTLYNHFFACYKICEKWQKMHSIFNLLQSFFVI